jgi:MraZ protein
VSFLGTFEYSMDERGRVPLPPKHRDAFRAGIVLGQGSPDKCIRVYPQEAYDKQSKQVLDISSWLDEGRDLRRMFFSRTFDTRLDPQNRVLVPGWMREYAGLENRVYLVGVGEWMELWSPENYESDIGRIEGGYSKSLARLVDRQR